MSNRLLNKAVFSTGLQNELNWFSLCLGVSVVKMNFGESRRAKGE